MIFDFLEDETFFNSEDKRIKFKTELVKRERQESNDSDELILPGETQDYLNSILPNNFFKFNRPTESVIIKS